MKKSITTSAILAVALLVGASSSAYAKKTEFYYQTYGGFIDGSVNGNAFRFKEGSNDVEEDGIWYREGPFSKAVEFGDQKSGNRQDIRDQIYGYATWPALTWGHPEQHPWVSEGGPGDDIGGASGVGLIGYGYKDAAKKGGRKIVVGEDKVLYPLGAVQHHNYNIHFFGSMDANVSWNMELYDKKGKLVFQGHNLFKMHQWETVNYNLKINDCPRIQLDEGQSITDTQFNTDQHAILNTWPVTGLGDTYYGDGHHEVAMPCADAFGMSGETMQEHFKVTDEKSGKETSYTIRIDGFYDYHPERKGCPKLDKGLYNVPKNDKDSSWSMKCFQKHPTFWSDEYSVNTGWMRLQITEDKIEEGCTCKEIKDITSLTMKWNGAKSTIVTFADGTVFNNGNPVNPGDEVTEAWSGKRAHDVIWTLSGETSGESLFHISCSDQEMNDEGDIGKAQGNGKKDEDGYINDWVLVDMGGEGGTLTDCSTPPVGTTCKDIKPIDALALTWTGSETITSINVYNKDRELIKTITDPIAYPLTVDGLDAGNSNDIIFEMMDANGKIGESIFHISCSEDDMDGVEDCGHLVGDGKQNDPTYLNKWTFNGMSGEGGNPTEFCTP